MTNYESLKAIFDAFDQLKVLVVGDVMIDSYLWGKSTRLSPEAPVPIVNMLKTEKRLGGAANVALNVQSLGATPMLCCVVGDDLEGADFIRLLEEKNMSSEGIFKSPERVTSVKQRIISGGQQLLRIDCEIETELLEHETRHLLEHYTKLLDKADVVIFEDYDKGVFTETNIAEMLQLAADKNIPTVVDPKKKNFLSYKNCTLFKPNLKELKEGLKVEFADANQEAFEKAARKLQRKLEAQNLLITLSERGVFMHTSDKHFYLDAHIRSISDVSGAGDTVISIAALCLALQLPAELLAGLANLGGGLVCEQIGVVPVDKTLLYNEAEEFSLFKNYAQRVA